MPFKDAKLNEIAIMTLVTGKKKRGGEDLSGAEKNLLAITECSHECCQKNKRNFPRHASNKADSNATFYTRPFLPNVFGSTACECV